ncbi:hypothetical protein [Streptosporangium sp. KLBMP 9127]|nr:hypothetical protein [Streptosporangium sp. KLBMP 9127]
MTIDHTYQALATVRDALPALEDALAPGTPRRWSQRDLTPDQRGQMDALARLERDAKEGNLAQGIKALGTGRAPLDLAVLDALAVITVGVAELEAAVADRLGLTPLHRASTAARITRIIGLLDRIAVQDDLAGHVEAEAVRLARSARRALGDTEPVHQLDARCPVCDSRSLRAFPERGLVMCVNASCQCTDVECLCHHPRPRRHWWPANEWPLLARVLRDDLGEAS